MILECVDGFLVIGVKIGNRTRNEIVNVDEEEENVNEEIILQDDEHDKISLDGVD